MNIFVACPHCCVTGGIELLHQLVHELNKHDKITAKIWYLKQVKDPQPKEYDIYENEYVTGLPPKDALLVFPEIWANYVTRFAEYDTAIYWESVDNYLSRFPVHKFPDKTLHLVQSYYAKDFLLNTVKVNPDKIFEVTDYINLEYLQPYLQINRQKQVLYNPSKGIEFTQQIIEAMPDVTFIPIQGMSREEVIHLMHQSTLYIDFGNHPGKDRLPREAAICGCCVITSRNGSAKFKEDVDIADEYKFDAVADNIPAICDKIQDVLDNYDTRTLDFEHYRSVIGSEHSLFQAQVAKLADELTVPRFSIIIPTYNAENHIRKALDSIKQQVFTDYELIVVCDSCTDNTVEIAKEYGAKTVVVNYHCDGPTRNTGIELARGEYLLFMDDDDWWLHEYVLTQLDEKLKETNADILCFSFIFRLWKYAKPRKDDGDYWIAVWNKCWRRVCIGNSRFSNKHSISDVQFHNQMLSKPLQVVEWDMPMYYYNFLREGSITEKDWRKK